MTFLKKQNYVVRKRLKRRIVDKAYNFLIIIIVGVVKCVNL